MGGSITLIACGKTTSLNKAPRPSPSDRPASDWPFETAIIPALTTSEMNIAV